MIEAKAMTDFVLPPPPVASVAVDGTEARFPVRRIICVGRNYAAHAREMGRDPTASRRSSSSSPPTPSSTTAATVPYPPET